MPTPPQLSGRPDLVTTVVRQVLPVIGLLALFGAAVRSASMRLANDDTFFHLRFGAEFLDGWDLNSPGSVTTSGTRDWVPTQWAAQIAMAWMESWGGPAAVAWLAGVGYLTLVLAVYLTCRREATPLIAATVTAAAYIAASQGLSARPQVISYVLVVVTVSAWLATARDGRPRWWLVPLTWAWASLHGMWPVGIVIGIVAVVAIALDEHRSRLLKLFWLPGLSLVAALLTPQGPRLVAEVAVVGSRGKYFAEWGPTDFHEPQPLVLCALLGLTVLIWLRSNGSSWLHGLLLLLAGAWCVFSLRTVPVAAVIAAPVAAGALMRLLPGQEAGATRKDLRWAWGSFPIAAAALALITPHSLSVGTDEIPDSVEKRLSAMPAGSVVLNEWEWGGFLMWKHPELDFVISGYGDVYTTDELDRNVDLVRVNPGWDEEVRELDPALAVLKRDTPLAYALERLDGWRVVTRDGDAVVLQPVG